MPWHGGFFDFTLARVVFSLWFYLVRINLVAKLLALEYDPTVALTLVSAP